MIESGQGVVYHFQGFGFLAYADNFTGNDRIGRDIHNLTVYDDMPVAYQLTGCSTRGGDSQTIHYIVQTALQELQQEFTGIAFYGSGTLKKIAELLLQHSVCVFCFLLLTKLNSILGDFSSPGIAMLTGSIVFLREHLVGTEDCFTEFTSDL